MSEMSSVSGRCLCGAVSFTITPVPREVHACHCSMCRRWSGGPALAFETQSIVLTGEENITSFQSSDWASRSFCKICGTNLYSRMLHGPEIYVSAGTLDDEAGLTLAAEIFHDEKPGYYSFAGDRPCLTGEEVIAQYAAAQGEPAPKDAP